MDGQYGWSVYYLTGNGRQDHKYRIQSTGNSYCSFEAQKNDTNKYKNQLNKLCNEVGMYGSDKKYTNKKSRDANLRVDIPMSFMKSMQGLTMPCIMIFRLLQLEHS